MEGKEILIVDTTVAPGDLGKNSNGWGGWGFHSKSKVAPTQEAMQDYQKKSQDICTINPGFGAPQSYKIIANSEVDKDFHKGHDGWEDFYKEHPKSLASGVSRVLAITRLVTRPYCMCRIPVAGSVALVISIYSQGKMDSG